MCDRWSGFNVHIGSKPCDLPSFLVEGKTYRNPLIVGGESNGFLRSILSHPPIQWYFPCPKNTRIAVVGAVPVHLVHLSIFLGGWYLPVQIWLCYWSRNLPTHQALVNVSPLLQVLCVSKLILSWYFQTSLGIMSIIKLLNYMIDSIIHQHKSAFIKVSYLKIWTLMQASPPTIMMQASPPTQAAALRPPTSFGPS